MSKLTNYDELTDIAKDIEERIIYKIRKKRVKNKITHGEISLKTGINKNHVSNIECCKIHPTLFNVIKYALSVGIDFNEILK